MDTLSFQFILRTGHANKSGRKLEAALSTSCSDLMLFPRIWHKSCLSESHGRSKKMNISRSEIITGIGQAEENVAWFYFYINEIHILFTILFLQSYMYYHFYLMFGHRSVFCYINS
jgi:hypothetical protein